MSLASYHEVLTAGVPKRKDRSGQKHVQTEEVSVHHNPPEVGEEKPSLLQLQKKPAPPIAGGPLQGCSPPTLPPPPPPPASPLENIM